MRMCREVRYDTGLGVRVLQHWMQRKHSLDPLRISVGARVKIGPQVRRRTQVVWWRNGTALIDVMRVKDVRGADRAESPYGAAEVHVVARDQQTPASGPESQDTRTVSLMEAVPLVHCEQPQLVVVRLRERG